MRKRRFRKRAMPYLLLAPFFLLMTVFVAGLVNAVLQSFGYLPAFQLNEFSLKYYIEILSDKKYLQSVGYSLWIAGISAVLAIVLGVLLCAVLLFVSNKTKGKLRFTRGVLKLPIFIPHTIAALFVMSLFSQTGLISRICYGMGLISDPEAFPMLLFDGAGIGVILAYLWKEIPFVWFFTMTLMGNISERYTQVSEGLGAGKWRTFFYVTLPLCRPTILGAFFIIFTYSFGAYELPFLLGATVPKALPVMSYIEYTHPDLLHRPYAMVLNVIMIAVSLIATYFYFRQLKKSTS